MTSANGETAILLIRPASAADIPAMMALEKHAVTAAHWNREQYVRVLGGSTSVVLLLQEDAVLEGFLVGGRVDAEWEIENVVIAGAARRRGLGTRLIGEFLSHARSQGAQSVYLEVRESNRAARLLYEKWAFLESGRRKGYYRDPEEDAVVYRLDFS
jgi:ribosomal-protein-alanine N-acetyltransferase